MSWAELCDALGARYGMSPFAVWREFSMRQLVILYNIASRSQWRERAFMAACQGASIGPEPDWNFGFSHSSKRKDMDDLQAYIARKKAKNNGG